MASFSTVSRTSQQGWFENLFGFTESISSLPRQPRTRLPTNPALNAYIQSQFDVVCENELLGYQSLISKANHRVFPIGKFTTPSLSELRELGRAAVAALPSHHAPLTVEHIIVDDLIALHAQSPGAAFQAASQFNW